MRLNPTRIQRVTPECVPRACHTGYASELDDFRGVILLVREHDVSRKLLDLPTHPVVLLDFQRVLRYNLIVEFVRIGSANNHRRWGNLPLRLVATLILTGACMGFEGRYR